MTVTRVRLYAVAAADTLPLGNARCIHTIGMPRSTTSHRRFGMLRRVLMTTASTPRGSSGGRHTPGRLDLRDRWVHRTGEIAVL